MNARPVFFLALLAITATVFLGHPNQRVDGYVTRDAIAAECR